MSTMIRIEDLEGNNIYVNPSEVTIIRDEVDNEGKSVGRCWLTMSTGEVLRIPHHAYELIHKLHI